MNEGLKVALGISIDQITKTREEVYIVRKIVHETQEITRQVSKRIYRFDAVTCPCGEKSLSMIVQEHAVEGGKATIKSFRCNACHRVPVMFHEFTPSQIDLLAWLGIRCQNP